MHRSPCREGRHAEPSPPLPDPYPQPFDPRDRGELESLEAAHPEKFDR